MLSKLLLYLSILLAFACCNPALSKPMPPPSFETAVKQSAVVVADYKSCFDIDKVDYFSGVNCRFKIARVLKSEEKLKVKAGDVIKVNYQFDDGTACIAPKPWKFAESMMPSKGTSMILFLNAKSESVFRTYRGLYGIKKHTAELEKKVLKAK